MSRITFTKNKPTKYQYLLYILIGILVFEGIVRKVMPQSIGLGVFFLKDFLCLYAIYLIAQLKLTSSLWTLQLRWKILLLALSPLLLYTAMIDLPLGLFAAKQYLLYVVVALLIPIAFPENNLEDFKRFSFFFALLVVPTTLVAILQNSLPASHWLNLSVGGSSLEAFSAAGFLRVSSTFSFTAQYSWFLNAVCAFVLLQYFIPYVTKYSLDWLIPVGLGILFLIGIFITGGRTAVIGSGGCIVLGFVLAAWKAPSQTIGKGAIIGTLMFLGLFLVRMFKPQFFAAYDRRSSGTETVSHEAEISGRILSDLIGWMDWFWVQEPISILIGNGMGIMSNGSDKISAYASLIRSAGFWTEGDAATIAWEGGLYLIIIWYGFRLITILFCFRKWLSIKSVKYSLTSSFLMANVIIYGLFGSIGIHPPMAIWWWMAVGSVLAIQGFDRYEVNLKASLNKRQEVNLLV